MWGKDRNSKTGGKRYFHCKVCKTDEKPHYSKGYCQTCYEKHALTKIVNPETGKFYTREERKTVLQRGYDRKRRAKRKAEK